MAIFDDREKSFEQKFRHDSELEFKISARRNKLLGLWVAGQMGLSGEEAEAYAKTVVMADLEKPGDEDVVEKVMADVKAKGVDLSEHRLRKRMTELLAEARAQVMAEAKD
jgi:hypothetical protein